MSAARRFVAWVLGKCATLAHHAIAHPIAGLLWVLGLDAAAEWLHAALSDPETKKTDPV